MELWLRFKKASDLLFDAKLEVTTQEEWQTAIKSTKPLSSILWPTEPLFRPMPQAPGTCFKRRHPHEKNYMNDSKRNASYREASITVASRIHALLKGKKILVYAPLRGAYPVWNAIQSHLTDVEYDVYYPVTSSFVFYPPEYKIMNQKGRPASGRFTHILELKRLRPFLSKYHALLYVDEIVSGGMMCGYLKDMINLEIHKEIPVIAVGIADAFGERFTPKKQQIAAMKINNLIEDFIWEGCYSLITEDQKFLLGIHYLDYHDGLNIIPMLTEHLHYYPEKIQFEQDVLHHNNNDSSQQ